MNRQLSPELTTRRGDIEALCRRLGVIRLDAFGSATTDAFHSESDFDFVVEFELAPASAGYAARYFELREELERLLGRPVDLVVDSAIKNPFFRRSVDGARVPLYAA